MQWFSSGGGTDDVRTAKLAGLSGSLPEFQEAGKAHQHNQRMVSLQKAEATAQGTTNTGGSSSIPSVGGGVCGGKPCNSTVTF